jgi:hypothetical protein
VITSTSSLQLISSGRAALTKALSSGDLRCYSFA